MSRPAYRWLAVPAAAGLIAAVLMVGGRTDAHVAACRGLLIPAYVPPDELLGIARTVRSGTIVVNPASGPGAAPHAGYREAVTAARDAGNRVLGYVPTAYGTRDPAAVAAEARRYATWYGTDGVFLDEAASGPDRLQYYRALAAVVRADGARMVVLNPGVVPDRGYFGVADAVVTFEGAYAEYGAARSRDPGWLAGVPREQIALLVYAATPAQARSLAASAGHAGHVYATPGRLPHPWGTLPAGVAGCPAPDRTDSLAATQGKTRLSRVLDPGRAS